MEALALGRCLYELEKGTMTLRGGSLWALKLVDKRGCGLKLTDQWGGGGEVLLLLSACVKDFDWGARQGSCGLRSVRRPWHTVVFCFGLVHFRQALADRSLTGQLFVARILCSFLLRGLPQCQSLLSQKIEG